MLSSILENGPAVLVPAAWIVALAAVTDTIGSQPLFIAHLIMSVFLAVFAVLGWQQMTEGVFRVWRVIIAVGLAVTLLGVVGFAGTEQPRLLAMTLYGWMVLPAVGLIYTGIELETRGWVYVAGGILSILGAIVAGAVTELGSLTGLELGIIMVGIGQTAGIVDAVFR